MRDASKTPEPMGTTPAGGGNRPMFVIQEHHATRLHHDFRLEHDGVLVSWALPKGLPTDPGTNHLAVQTEDHPLDYGSFEGTIPKGEYGAGEVTIWDTGVYDLEKWRDGEEVIVTIHGERHGSHRLALIRTGGDHSKPQWLIHLMKEQQAPPEGAGHARSRSTGTGRGLTRGKTVVGTAKGRTADTLPMLATAAEPADLDGASGWRFEMKWDGIRALARVQGDELSLWSRNGLDLTGAYPELARLVEALGSDAVVDGEIVALDESGVPSFSLLQERMGLTRDREIERARRRVPVRYLLFDALEVDGGSVQRLPYAERREVLARLVRTSSPIDVPPDAGDDLDAALETSLSLGLEGIMAKRIDSPYRAGRRSRDWRKITHTLIQEVVVGGWRTGKGDRARSLGSLLVGVPDEDGRLRYVGRVGSGFSDRDLTRLRSRFDARALDEPALDGVPPEDARDAHWVEPLLVGEVEHSGITPDGRLRHPVWRGERPDKHPADVRWEPTSA